MDGISDIRIVGLDPLRAPRIRKEPYIDLYFQLSHKAPADWCQAFNDQSKKAGLTALIKDAEGLFVETWVRKAEEIPALLERLRHAVNLCNESYLARIAAEKAQAALVAASATAAGGEQQKLNAIIAALNFDA